MRGDIIDLDALAEAVEERLARRMVSQKGSPLGSRTHRAAVIRRVECQEGGAAIANNGRKFLLSRAALQEELDRSTKEHMQGRTPLAHHRKAGERRMPRKAHADQSPDLDELQREITGGLRSIREVR